MTTVQKYKIIFKDEILFYLIKNITENTWCIKATLESKDKEISQTGAEQILKRLAWLKID
jgi:hypothetical protein